MDLDPTPLPGPACTVILRQPHPRKFRRRLGEVMRTMLENTRLSARKVPSQFGFIQIFGDEGGRILDFSESGLAFESFSPLGPAKTLQFWFSLNLKDRVEATGEVVWLDSTCKKRGLRFMDLTDRAMPPIRTQYN